MAGHSHCRAWDRPHGPARDERRPDPVPAFTSLASGPGTDLKVLATGLAVGVLLDATVIRALLVPAVVSLFGRWNWWLPRLPARLLRVEPSLPTRTVAREGAV
ncbi:MAG TPA: MMPL family transporter [Solirubrobacteraceae bacterium]